MKEAQTGGRFVWHQDFAYWYRLGCVLPEMMSVFMPIDRYTIIPKCASFDVQMTGKPSAPSSAVYA